MERKEFKVLLINGSPRPNGALLSIIHAGPGQQYGLAAEIHKRKTGPRAR